MNKQYIVKVKDKEGIVWVYEGDIRGNPIFTEEEFSEPLLMSFADAHDVELKYGMDGDKYIIEGV